MPGIKDAMQLNSAEPADANNSNAVSAKEQEDYDRTVNAALGVIYEDSMHKNIMQMLSSGKESPAKTLANVTAMIIQSLDEKSGGQIPETVILPAAEEILGEIAELAHKAKVFSVDESILSEAEDETSMQLMQVYDPQGEGAEEFLNSVDKGEVEKVRQRVGNASQPQPQPQPPTPGAQPPPEGM